jgi:hypothetical protein
LLPSNKPSSRALESSSRRLLLSRTRFPFFEQSAFMLHVRLFAPIVASPYFWQQYDVRCRLPMHGSGLPPYLPKALAIPWHANQPPLYAKESRFAWSGRTDVDTIQHYIQVPNVPIEVATSPSSIFTTWLKNLPLLPVRSLSAPSTGWTPAAQPCCAKSSAGTQLPRTTRHTIRGSLLAALQLFEPTTNNQPVR